MKDIFHYRDMEEAKSIIEKHISLSKKTMEEYSIELDLLYEKACVYFGMDYENPLAENLFLERIERDPENLINIVDKNWTGKTKDTYLNIMIMYLKSLMEEKSPMEWKELKKYSSTIDKYSERYV